MAKVIGLEKALAKLEGKIRKAAGDADVGLSVGYGAPYALRVHEDLEMVHPRGGQAKYLQEPATVNADLYGSMVVDALKAGKTMRQALMAAATALKNDSQELVPVLTGALRASAFIRVDIGKAAKVARGR